MRSPSEQIAYDAVVDDLVVRAVVALGEEALGDPEADAVRDALPERARGRLDAGRVMPSGWPGVREPHWRNRFSSSSERS